MGNASRQTNASALCKQPAVLKHFMAVVWHVLYVFLGFNFLSCVLGYVDVVVS